MKVGERFDLTYCSNIHPGEQWPQVAVTLAASLPEIRRQLNVTGPFGIGLRLSAAAALQLEEPSALADFREFLQAGDYYVPTMNGFPYGAFHGTRVKDRVYQPDWRSAERLDYTNRLARLIAQFALDRGEDSASISTVPGAFQGHLRTSRDVETIADGILKHAAFLKQLMLETGVLVTLALEPEPACFMETVDDAVRFFQAHLFAAERVALASRQTGIAFSEDDVVRHIGVCLDACHMAVEFENAGEAVSRLRGAGIAVNKVQLSSALRVAAGSARSPIALLAPFAEDTYFHQVVTRQGDTLTRFVDLPEALHSVSAADAVLAEWRVHFHVPIFLESMSGFETTQAYLTEVLELLRGTAVCGCLEVETYTWDVLPPAYRTTDICTAIARELAWVRERLE